MARTDVQYFWLNTDLERRVSFHYYKLQREAKRENSAAIMVCTDVQRLRLSTDFRFRMVSSVNKEEPPSLVQQGF